MRKAWVVAWGIALSGCGGSAPEVKPVETPVVEAPKPPGIPEIEGKNGVVFAPDGLPRELRVVATGESVEVNDGTPLTLRNIIAAEGFGRSEAEVEIDGQVGILPNDAVLVGERMRRSPGSKVAIFTAIRECDPKCVTVVWALHPDGRRLQVAPAVEEPSFAFSPDGTQVAVGGKGLWLLQAGTWKVFAYKEFAAPAFAFDNSLYVRSHGATDTVLRFFTGGQVYEVASLEGTPTVAIPVPVTFEDGGKTIVAVFSRAGGDKTVRVPK